MAHIPARMKAWQALERIHKAGVMHCDMQDYHVVHQNGDVRIVDFDAADKEHECKHLLVKPYEYPPLRLEFGCEEIYDFLVGCEIYTLDSESVPPLSTSSKHLAICSTLHIPQQSLQSSLYIDRGRIGQMRQSKASIYERGRYTRGGPQALPSIARKAR